jgi:hypothetical protein
MGGTLGFIIFASFTGVGALSCNSQHFMPQSCDKPIDATGSGQVISAVQRAMATLSVRLANLVPGDAEVPDFPIRGEDEMPEDSLRFEFFVEQNFPRAKFADLRRELDRAARSKATTAVRFYRSMVETREMLRSAVKVMDWLAGLENRRPVLRICEGCGKIFSPFRKDKMHCSDTCHDRRRQANLRYWKQLYKENRVRKENETEKQTKARARK